MEIHVESQHPKVVAVMSDEGQIASVSEGKRQVPFKRQPNVLIDGVEYHCWVLDPVEDE